jgi:hypothetical protein
MFLCGRGRLAELAARGRRQCERVEEQRRAAARAAFTAG